MLTPWTNINIITLSYADINIYLKALLQEPYRLLMHMKVPFITKSPHQEKNHQKTLTNQIYEVLTFNDFILSECKLSTSKHPYSML